MLWIVLTKEQSLLSRAIRWITRGSYSHALLLWEDKRLGWLRMEAGWDGYHIRPATAPSGRPQRLARIVMSANSIAVPLSDEFDSVLTHCAKFLGRPYDYPGAAGIVWIALGRILRRSWRNPLASTRALFCSEAIAEALKEHDYPGFATVDPSTVTPQGLLDLLTKSRQMAWVIHE